MTKGRARWGPAFVVGGYSVMSDGYRVTMALINMVGFKSGILTVVSMSDPVMKDGKRGQARWLCACACGGTTVVRGQDLRLGKTKSCGCATAASISASKTRHGHAKRGGRRERDTSPTYRSWAMMVQRCTNKNFHKFKDYGGRGIALHEPWRSFDAFLSDMGERPSDDHSIDRIDVNGNYEPSNCRWATTAQQSVNKRNSVLVERDGALVPMRLLAIAAGVSPATAIHRLRTGKTVDECLKPVGATAFK